MILERLMQRGKKLFDNGKHRIQLWEKDRLLLVVANHDNMYTEASTIAMVDLESGEIGTMYADQSLKYEIDEDLHKMVKLGLRMVEHGKM